MADEPRRITPDQVREAMAKTGLSVKPGVTLDLATKCGCPMGVIAESILPDSGAYSIDRATQIIGLPWTYGMGFGTGFDGHKSLYTSNPTYVNGHADGLRCRRELLEGVSA